MTDTSHASGTDPTGGTTDTADAGGSPGVNGDAAPSRYDRPPHPLVIAAAGVVGAGALFVLGALFNLALVFGVGGVEGFDTGVSSPARHVQAVLFVTVPFGLPTVLVLAVMLWWARVRRPLAAAGLLLLIAVLCMAVSVVQDLWFPFAPEPLLWTLFGYLAIGGAALAALLWRRGLGFTAVLAVVPLLAWTATVGGWHAYVQAQHTEATTAGLTGFRDMADGAGPGFVLLDAAGWEARHATAFHEPDPHSILIYEGPDGRRVALVQGTDPMNGSRVADPLWEGCDAPGTECFEYPAPAGLGEGTAVLRIPAETDYGETDRIRIQVAGVVLTLGRSGPWEPMDDMEPGYRAGPLPDAFAEELVGLLDHLRPVEPDDLRELAEADTRSLAEIY
ncbi:hypothetical protein [Nocardiopsis protaetiae]|uniref:hypothetical protein n=1 Tax=Nocardiopsis protaetiae TaxID=3382270 RepID=UPI00387B5B6B